jgi:hypothetical protein
MAILRPFECAVEVNGVAVDEYEDEDAEPANTATVLTKYIEVVSGTNFTLVFTIQQGWAMHADCVSFKFSLDGKPIVGCIIPKESCREDRSVSIRRSSLFISSGQQCVKRKFRFADITIGTSEESAKKVAFIRKESPL